MVFHAYPKLGASHSICLVGQFLSVSKCVSAADTCSESLHSDVLNPLAPSDPYMGRTAQLTSRRCILNTYSTNTRTEYFKCAA
jgi:hypothetical protein